MNKTDEWTPDDIDKFISAVFFICVITAILANVFFGWVILHPKSKALRSPSFLLITNRMLAGDLIRAISYGSRPIAILLGWVSPQTGVDFPIVLNAFASLGYFHQWVVAGSFLPTRMTICRLGYIGKTWGPKAMYDEDEFCALHNDIVKFVSLAVMVVGYVVAIGKIVKNRFDNDGMETSSYKFESKLSVQSVIVAIPIVIDAIWWQLAVVENWFGKAMNVTSFIFLMLGSQVDVYFYMVVNSRIRHQTLYLTGKRHQPISTLAAGTTATK